MRNASPQGAPSGAEGRQRDTAAKPPRTRAEPSGALVRNRLRLLLSRAFTPRNSRCGRPWAPLTWLGAVVLLSAAFEVLAWKLGNMTGEFYGALLASDHERFREVVLMGAVLSASQAVAKATRTYFSSRLALAMRVRLTLYCQDRYADARARFYTVGLVDPVDNPDQRVTQDIEQFVELFQGLVVTLCLSPVLLAWYTVRTARTVGLPGALVVWAYFGLGAAVCHVGVTPLSRRVAERDRAEGDFRFCHVKIRDAAPEAAVAGAVTAFAAERQLLDTHFGSVVARTCSLLRLVFLVDVLTDSFGYFGAVFTYIVIGFVTLGGVRGGAEPIPTSPDELGQFISQSAFAIMYLVYQITSITGVAEQIGRIGGYASRAGALVERLDAVDLASRGTLGGDSPHSSSTDPLLRPEPLGSEMSARLDMEPVERLPPTHPLPPGLLVYVRDLTVRRPAGPADSLPFPVLVETLDLDVRPGSHTLILGPNGVGKSTLVRALAGVWPWYSASAMALAAPCIILPQNPYTLPLSPSVYSQLQYPQPCDEQPGEADSFRMSRMRAALQSVGLGALSEHLDDPLPPLSRGELQRLLIARLLVHAPPLAILDEPVASMDPASGQRLLDMCISCGTTLVVISQRELCGFSQTVRLFGGAWRLSQ